jgi:hypothetical protein
MSNRKRSLNRVSRADTPVRLFILESPGPLDALEGRAEGPALSQISKLIGHQVVTFPIISASQFDDCCDYISTITDYEDTGADTPICIHISAHGLEDGTGLCFGGNEVHWTELMDSLLPIFRKNMAGPLILVLSACNANRQELTRAIEKHIEEEPKISPPKYVFCSNESVPWSDAAVGWTVFYHLLPAVNLENRDQVKDTLKKIKSIGLPKIWYYRWDVRRKEYFRYENKS